MPEGRESSSSDYKRVGVFNRWRQYTGTEIADAVEAPKGNRLKHLLGEIRARYSM